MVWAAFLGKFDWENVDGVDELGHRTAKALAIREAIGIGFF